MIAAALAAAGTTRVSTEAQQALEHQHLRSTQTIPP
jgi:hypothetical protein